MELRQLRYAEAVARHRHFTRAAEELNVSQPALSHQVRRLEEELGTELFRRTSRRVEATEAGTALALRARRILAEADALRGDVDQLRGLVRGRLTVGALLPAGGVDVIRIVSDFTAAFPGIDVGLREGRALDIAHGILRDEIDVAFSLSHPDLPGGLTARRVSSEPLVAALPPGSETGPPITPADLAEGPLIVPGPGSALRRAVDDFLAGATPPAALETNDLFMVRCLVSAGMGVALMPRSFPEMEGPPLTLRPLSPASGLDVLLLVREGRAQPPPAAAFLDFAERAADRLDTAPTASG